ncbi:MAG: hypothetical protein B6229_10030 [Spirochaetaceae bacterium 4572_7]|nr:MAG: hypothetical protein B6229_10030 [Spirochaetaceae bacterium 4572_7]
MFLNVALLAGLFSTILAQIIKFIVILVSEKRLAWDRIKSTGGMPSSHSAGVAALATSVGMIDGVGSTTFAIASGLALIVMYDATGIRRAAGLHAEYLNVIVKELSHIFKQDGEERKALKTLLGHTFLQVIAGLLQGVYSVISL